MKKLEFLEPDYTELGIYELSLNERNHRKISKKGFNRLKDKITQNVYEPIKVWKQGNVVLSGNQRLGVIRHLVEEENYEIDKVKVAVYDVDERTAKFIQLADNEHDGSYDYDKLLEDMEELESLDLLDILDPAVLKKLSTDVTSTVIEDVDEKDFEDIVEIETSSIQVSNIPKTDLALFYDGLKRIAKVTGVKGEWRCLKVALDLVAKSSDEHILRTLDY